MKPGQLRGALVLGIHVRRFEPIGVRMTRIHRLGGRSRILAVLAGAFALAALVAAPDAFAVHDTGVFQLDGDASSSTQPAPPYPQAVDDWDKVCHQYGTNPAICGTTSNTTGSTAGLWTCDTSLNATQSCTINA